MIRKVVIPAAGLGTRLLSATKEQPKEMMPIFAKDNSNSLCVKPLLQLLFEQLYGLGFREFCFIVGRGKRAIEDHFTPEYEFINQLNKEGKNKIASNLEAFYDMVKGSNIIWVNQPEPKGFGHAVLMAKPFISEEHSLSAQEGAGNGWSGVPWKLALPCPNRLQLRSPLHRQLLHGTEKT